MFSDREGPPADMLQGMQGRMQGYRAGAKQSFLRIEAAKVEAHASLLEMRSFQDVLCQRTVIYLDTTRLHRCTEQVHVQIISFSSSSSVHLSRALYMPFCRENIRPPAGVVISTQSG